MPNLVYTDADHAYHLDGVRLLSVTQILEATGLSLVYTGDPWYGDRGRAVHAATMLDDQGTLDEATVDPRIVGYLEAWRRYRRESGFTPIGGERPLYHPLYRYAGTPDRWDASLLIDIKTSKEAPWHVLQRAAYRALLKQADVKIKRDCCVYLSADGHYTTSKASSTPHDLNIFLSAVNIYHWREQHNGDTGSAQR